MDVSNDGRRIVWDERNLYHLLVERAQRGITVEDVEHVLLSKGVRFRTLKSGADLSVGRAPGGRPLAVITIGSQELYPRTAWWVTEKQWRKLYG